MSLLEQPIGSRGLGPWEEADKAPQKQVHIKSWSSQEGPLLGRWFSLGRDPVERQGGYGQAELGPGAPGRKNDLSTRALGGRQGGNAGTFLSLDFGLCPAGVRIGMCPRPG